MFDEIKPEVVALAQALQKHIKIASTTDLHLGRENIGVCVLTKDIFVELLPNDISQETIEKVLLHMTNLRDAAALAAGSASVDYIKENKNIQFTYFVLPGLAGDSIECNFTVSSDSSVDKDIQYGKIHSSYGLNTHNSPGELPVIKNYITELTKKELNIQ